MVDARAQIVEELSVGPSGGREDLVVMTEILRLVDYQIEPTEPVGGGQQQLQLLIGERLALVRSQGATNREMTTRAARCDTARLQTDQQKKRQRGSSRKASALQSGWVAASAAGSIRLSLRPAQIKLPVSSLAYEERIWECSFGCAAKS